jgi:metallopeptidase MepB
MREPPQAPPSFESTTVATIENEVQFILHDSALLQDHLATTLTPSTATFANLVRPLLDDANKAKCRTVILIIILSRNSPDPGVRRAAREAQKRIAAEEARSLLRSDIASLVAAVLEKEKDSQELDEEDRHALAHLHGRFLRAGANLDKAKRIRLEEAQSEISEINSAAIKAFTEVEDGIWFTRDELAGCTESWLVNLKKDVRGENEIFWVTFRDDHYVYVQQYAKSEDTRRRIFLGSKRQFPENIERLSKLVVIRDRVARLLGYENHAALRMEDTMMRSVKALQERLLSLHARLYPLAMVETSAMAALKSRQANEKTTEDDVKIYSWDRLYYGRIQSEQEFAVDTTRFSEYYEINHVLSEMLKVFGDIFGMEFVFMPHLSTWHESVSPFSVWNNAAEGAGFLGYLYLDVYGRPAKFSSQYHSRIQPVCRHANLGITHHPYDVSVTNDLSRDLLRPTGLVITQPRP